MPKATCFYGFLVKKGRNQKLGTVHFYQGEGGREGGGAVDWGGGGQAKESSQERGAMFPASLTMGWTSFFTPTEKGGRFFCKATKENATATKENATAPLAQGRHSVL